MVEIKCIGRLTKEPETRLTKEEKKVVNISIATNDKDQATFIKFTTFGKVAETIEKYSHKGDLVLIDGVVKNNDYIDKNGNKHYEYVFIGNRVEFLSRATNDTSKKETPKKEDKNGLDTQAFIDFGNSIEIEESELAF